MPHGYWPKALYGKPRNDYEIAPPVIAYITLKVSLHESSHWL
jgi:hypothetical protein